MRHSDFEKEFRRMKIIAIFTSAVSILLTIAGAAALGYIAYKTLIYYGIL